MSDTITYKTIIDRCKDDVMEYTPDIPKENTQEAWQDFIDALETFRDESYGHAHESIGSWDWTIYTHYGWKILAALDQDEINRAEESYIELNYGIEVQDLEGGAFCVYGIQSSVAYFALVNIWIEQAYEIVSELLELAETQKEN